MSTPTTDPQAVRAQERHSCTFCVALRRLAIQRRDLTLIEVAERLRAEHLAADADREQFAQSVAVSIRAGSRHADRPKSASLLPRCYPEPLRARR
jgi:hypothetical protein